MAKNVSQTLLVISGLLNKSRVSKDPLPIDPPARCIRPLGVGLLCLKPCWPAGRHPAGVKHDLVRKKADRAAKLVNILFRKKIASSHVSV